MISLPYGEVANLVLMMEHNPSYETGNVMRVMNDISVADKSSLLVLAYRFIKPPNLKSLEKTRHTKKFRTTEYVNTF